MLGCNTVPKCRYLRTTKQLKMLSTLLIILLHVLLLLTFCFCTIFPTDLEKLLDQLGLMKYHSIFHEQEVGAFRIKLQVCVARCFYFYSFILFMQIFHGVGYGT